MSQNAQFTELKLPVPWGHVAAKAYGPSTGKSVLMVHGMQDNAGTFTRLMKYLPTDFYYVCIDLPSHGFSSHFPSAISIEVFDFVYAIHFILEALRWKTCIYIGHSFGGQIGIFFSILQPHRIKKIICIDVFLPYTDTDDNSVSYFKKIFESVIKSHNTKPRSYTKEEVLYAFKNMRIAALCSDAAETLFERGVTKINEKYIYNRDIRLNYIESRLTLIQLTEFANKLSVPICTLIASEGLRKHAYLGYTLLKIVNQKTLLKIIHINGNHDVHNNNPEKVGPIIYKLLNNDNSSKL